MKGKSTAYRFTKVLLIVCVILMLPINVWAQETTLTTVVPSSHTLHIEMIGRATLCVDGIAYTKSAEVQILRYSSPQISVQVTDGYRAKSVLWGNTNITNEIQIGTWTAPAVTEDIDITIILEEISNAPQTMDNFRPELWLLIAGGSLSVIVAFLLICKKKKT